MSAIWSATIEGEPCSKANSRRLVVIHGRPAVIKSAKAIAYCKAFEKQAAFETRTRKPYTGDVTVFVDVWYASRRPDLDESLILDCLQGHAYANDRQVKRKHITWCGVDKARPRAEINVYAMEEVQ